MTPNGGSSDGPARMSSPRARRPFRYSKCARMTSFSSGVESSMKVTRGGRMMQSHSATEDSGLPAKAEREPARELLEYVRQDCEQQSHHCSDHDDRAQER